MNDTHNQEPIHATHVKNLNQALDIILQVNFMHVKGERQEMYTLSCEYMLSIWRKGRKGRKEVT